jgi:hypothetical protein
MISMVEQKTTGCSLKGHGDHLYRLDELSLDTKDRVTSCCIPAEKSNSESTEGVGSDSCGLADPLLTVYVLCKCFADLVPLQMLVFYASLVVPQPFDRYPLFPFVESFGGDWAVRKEDHHHHAPHTTQGSDYEEFELPRWQACFDVPDSGIYQLICNLHRLDDVTRNLGGHLTQYRIHWQYTRDPF